MRFSLAANRRLLVTAALWAAVAVSGQELTRTQIADTLFNADGSRAVGSLRINWKSFTGADGAAVAKNSVDLDIVDGIVSVALAPNLGAVPDGTYYAVEYRLNKGEKSNEVWIVPDSEDPVTIADIRVLSIPAAGMAVSLAQVSGLQAMLDAKAAKAATNTFTAPQVMREDAPGTSNPLLGLEKNDGAAGVYFKLPELSGDVTYTLPPNAGAPNQALTTDGSGALFWSTAAGGGSGSGYQLLQQGGTSVTQRTAANFTNGFTVSDNSGQLRTDITPNFGTAAGTITEGDDSRLSDPRSPLAHSSTHAAGGSDPLTPASIGALNRTNDFMAGASPATPVLTLQGATGQSAALQEWRDGVGALAASITADGNGFFRQLGVSAPTGVTTAAQSFEIGGLKKFALSAADDVFDILRYDNAGDYLDRPLRIFRNGNIETAVSMKVTDAGIGSGSLGLTGNYLEVQGVAAPSNPASGFGRLFLNSANGEVSVKKSSGAVVSLELGGGGGGVGDVVGAASSIDNALPRFDGTGGKTLQSSGLIVDDSDSLTVPGAVYIGSGAVPLNLTGYTDDAAPSAPGATNQFTAYYDRSSGLHCWIINGGTAQCSLTPAQIDTAAEINALTTDTDFLTLDAQNGGTDYTADLEEETHASEHEEDGADELFAEDLGTACTVGQIVVSDGSGGLDCEDAPSGGGGGEEYGCTAPIRQMLGGNAANVSVLGPGVDRSGGGVANTDHISQIYLTDGNYVTWAVPVPDCWGGSDITWGIYDQSQGAGTGGGALDIETECINIGEHYNGAGFNSEGSITLPGTTTLNHFQRRELTGIAGSTCVAGSSVLKLKALFTKGTWSVSSVRLLMFDVLFTP